MSFVDRSTGEIVHAEIKKVSWWHKSIVDLMLQNPGMTNNEMAAHFNVTAAWMSTIKHSDAFKAYFELRREAHSAKVSESVIEKTEELAKLSLDVLTDRIKTERETIGLGGVLDTAKLTLSALGFGGQSKGPGAIVPGAGGVNVQVNVSADLLNAARAKMHQVAQETSEQLQITSNRPGEPIVLEGSSRETSSASAA